MGYRELASIPFKIVVVYCRRWCRLVDRLGDVCGWGEYAENSVGVDAPGVVELFRYTGWWYWSVDPYEVAYLEVLRSGVSVIAVFLS